MLITGGYLLTMDETKPGPDETGGEDWVEPTTTEPVEPEPKAERFGLTPELQDIFQRVTDGEQLTKELYCQFEDLTRAAYDELQPDLADNARTRFEVAIAGAMLKDAGGLHDDAIEDLEALWHQTSEAGATYQDIADKIDGLLTEYESRQP